MPTIIDYLDLQRRLLAGGLVCLYHNSGAWGFASDAPVQTMGWIVADDPSIRPAVMQLSRRIPELANLGGLLEQVARRSGPALLTPKSHWHYELHFGNPELLEALLPAIGINPALLRDRNDGSAIAFAGEESSLLRQTIQRLLESLRGSDFQLTFPDHQTVCTIHHHRQLWWQTTDPVMAAELRDIKIG